MFVQLSPRQFVDLYDNFKILDYRFAQMHPMLWALELQVDESGLVIKQLDCWVQFIFDS